ncbi:hypothetical protein Riv7116_6467 [Rivularia sp. PCC 7116]|uniref:type IV pilin-like G/H family protein n=1 Tax=Rivularia sp. PCC 7116 TaxID=373994 RepID=UPI00029EEDC1|nr:type IV pilin-like G/H family protein [Rivularia sp. PCC 7116]AFY58797.1 hypothetical protein Riv7116_6467 [Rivularia sp. PCC 7116]
MKKIWTISQILKNISSKNIFVANKLTTIGLLLVVAAISGCNSSSNAQSSASEKWTGEWELKDPGGSGQSMKIILTPEGKAYLIPPEAASSDKVAYDIPLEKVSETTSLPAGTKVVALADIAKNQANKARESEGKTYVGSMNRGNQAYYLENNKFATKLEELKLGIKSETENYVYKVVPQSNESKSVMNIAKAKGEGLNSYVGLVYLTKIKSGEYTTFAKLCETSQALSSTPQMPIVPTQSSEEMKCPSGFKPLS